MIACCGYLKSIDYIHRYWISYLNTCLSYLLYYSNYKSIYASLNLNKYLILIIKSCNISIYSVYNALFAKFLKVDILRSIFTLLFYKKINVNNKVNSNE